MSFGDRLLELLDEKNITQKDFAKRINIAPTTLNGYIKNNRRPDFETLKLMASVLNVSTDYLLDNPADTFTLSPSEQRLICNLRNLETKQRNLIFELVEIISKNQAM
jgi:transcriptional regulator with XRE-family HTH domain